MGSITHWIGELKAGNRDAAQPLWNHYFQRLVFLARQRLQGAAGGAADEEDVALSVFNSFFHHAPMGVFPDLKDRDDLWQLLVTKTARKAVDVVRSERAQKRGGQHKIEVAVGDWEQVLGTEPTPDFAAQVAEECQRLLGQLPEDLRQLAVWRMEGYTVEEISQRVGCVDRTVKRRLQLIRSLWGKEELT